MDYRQDPLYKKFKQEQSQNNQQQNSSYKQDPLYAKFKQEKQRSQKRLETLNEYIPDFAEDFIYGSAKNIADYTASAAKMFGNNDLQRRARVASETLDNNVGNEWARLAGEIIGDPLNLTPAGIVSKGSKVGKIGKVLTKTKPRAVATSMGLGAGIGAGTMAAKDYGNDAMSTTEKVHDAELGAGIVAGLNGLISAFTKGRVNNVIKPEMVQGAKSDEDIANAILKNSDAFGLTSDEASAVHSEVLKGKYPKVPDAYKVEQAGFVKKSQPNFQMRPNNPPATMDINTALAVLAREADKKRVAQGLEPIYQHKYQVQSQYRKESIYPQQQEQPYTPNFVSGDFNNNIPVPYNADAELMQRYHAIASHPRLQELLSMREGVSAKDAQSPQRVVSKGGYRELDGYGGENKHAYDRAVYEKNYAHDFHLTKQDIGKLYRGQYDDNLLSKLETDLDTLDNHPDYAEPMSSINDIDYKEELAKLDDTDVSLTPNEWEEANTVFAKGLDNVAAGTYAGIGQDENGNITFDPEKFILGLGGYTAVKAALKNGTIRGKLKDIAVDALDRVNFNPEVQKQGNSFNSMSPVKMGDNSLSTIDDVKETLSKHRGQYTNIEYTKDNWNKLFPNNTVETPLGKVKLGENQFEKLDPTIPDPKDITRVKQDRRHHLSYIEQTLKEPAFAIKKDDGSKLLYFKEIENGNKVKQYSSIMIDKDGMHISISSHPMNYKQIKKEINKNDVVYIAKEVTTNGATKSHPTSKIVEDKEKKGYEISLITDNSSSNSKIIPQKEEKNLIAQHNLTEDNVKFADKHGGLAVPSIAITKKDTPLDGFGDITLLGDKEMITPKRDTKTYGADIYSPRYPQVKKQLSHKAIRNIEDDLNKYHKLVGNSSYVDPENLADDLGLKMKFLESKGYSKDKVLKYDTPKKENIEIAKTFKSFYDDGKLNRDYVNDDKFILKVKEFLRNKIGDDINDWSETQIQRVAKNYAQIMKDTIRKMKKGKSADFYETRSNVSNIINKKHSKEFKDYVNSYYKQHGAEEKIYDGTDRNGRQKWIDHTIDNVVKKLKKNLRGGEGFNYGTGSIRALHTPQFKTLAQIQKAKDKLVSKDEFEAIKKEIEDEYFRVADEFDNHIGNSSFGSDEFNGVLSEIADKPLDKVLHEYGIEDLPKSIKDDIENLKIALKEMPTEYFETKILRKVDLGEFKVALVPNGTSKETIELLKKKGLKVSKYNPKIDGARAEKIAKVAEKEGILFVNPTHTMAGSFAGGSDTAINQRDYNGDGKTDIIDILIGAGIGAAGINALKKAAPKLFEDEAGKDGFKAGLFAGSKAKGFDAAKRAGKTFDGKYDTLERFEIDDSKAKLKNLARYVNTKDGTKLENILDHKELFDNYPELKDISVKFHNGSGSSFSRDGIEIGIKDFKTKDDFKSTLLHELQHSIQKEEGFARGGSAQEFYNDFKKKINLLKYELEFEPDDFIRDKKLKQLSELESKYKDGGKEEAFKMYQNLAGEIEARDIQARADYTPEQREKIAPYSSEDIAQEDAVMRFNNANEDLFKNMSENKKEFESKIQEAKKKGYAHLSKIVSKEAQKEWGDAASTLKRWFTDTLGAKYHDIRESATASTNGMSVKLERLHRALKELNEADRVSLHDYIAGETNDINPTLKPLADKLKQDIDNLSKDLVSKGVLTQEQYDEWAGYYIHRNYEQHFFKDVKNLMKRGFKIDDIHKRGNIQEISEKEAKKLLVDPKFIASTQKPLRDGGQRLTKLANGKYELRRDWTRAERDAMNEIRDGAITIPETLMRLKRMADNAKFLEDVSKIDEVILKDAEKFSDDEISAAGFVKAPNSPKYGVLAGKHIRKDVFDDISARNDEIFNTFYGSDGAIARIWKNYLSLWKKSKTVWNVPSHLNNFMSNQFLMHLAGMRADEIVTSIGRAGKMMYEGNRLEKLMQKKMLGQATKAELKELEDMGEDLKYFLEAKDGGLLGRSQLNDILAGQQKIDKKGVLGKIDKFSEDMYHGEDAINKIAMYAHLREKVGMSADEARKAVLTIMPDYSKPMPMGYRVLRDTGISPFISWSYYTMPAIWKLLKTSQGAKKASLAMGTLAGLEYVLTGGAVTPLDNIPFYGGNKPEDFKGRRFGIGRSGDTIHTLKTDRWIPYIELTDPINFFVSNISGPSTNAVVNTLTSLSKAGMINPYYGRPVTYKNKGAGQKAYDYAKYLTQSYVPLPAQAYSGWNLIESLARSKKNRRRNKVIEPRTPTQEILKNIGLNSLSYSRSQARKENND